jgi:hypothetical protein
MAPMGQITTSCRGANERIIRRPARHWSSRAAARRAACRKRAHETTTGRRASRAIGAGSSTPACPSAWRLSDAVVWGSGQSRGRCYNSWIGRRAIIMGGVFRKTAPAVAEAAKQVTASQPAASKPAEQMAAEDRSARRRARRGARALLSESRLNPEEGVTTLGQTGL